jgi:O-methyltransferase
MQINDRYLGLLKNALLNEIYIENDVRLLYVFAALHTGQNIDLEIFRNVATRVPDWVAAVKASRQEGGIWWHVNIKNADGSNGTIDLRNVCEFAHTMVGRKRLDNIENCLAKIRKDNVPGDVAETGVWRGGAAIFMKGCLTAWGMQDRTVWVADSFEGLPVPSLPEDAGYDFSVTKVPILAVGLEEVQENFRRYDLLDDKVRFLKGWFKDTLHVAPIRELALLRLDGDLYESTMDSLKALYDKVSREASSLSMILTILSLAAVPSWNFVSNTASRSRLRLSIGRAPFGASPANENGARIWVCNRKWVARIAAWSLAWFPHITSYTGPEI